MEARKENSHDNFVLLVVIRNKLLALIVFILKSPTSLSDTHLIGCEKLSKRLNNLRNSSLCSVFQLVYLALSCVLLVFLSGFFVPMCVFCHILSVFLMFLCVILVLPVPFQF